MQSSCHSPEFDIACFSPLPNVWRRFDNEVTESEVFCSFPWLSRRNTCLPNNNKMLANGSEHPPGGLSRAKASKQVRYLSLPSLRFSSESCHLTLLFLPPQPQRHPLPSATSSSPRPSSSGSRGLEGISSSGHCCRIQQNPSFSHNLPHLPPIYLKTDSLRHSPLQPPYLPAYHGHSSR